MVDDIDTQLRQTINIGFARPVIPSFYCVVKEAVDAVSVILVILGRVDSALSRDAVCTSWGILKAKRKHVIAQLAHARGGRSSGQSRTDNNHGVLSLVGRIDQLHFKFAVVPFFL